jgi:hypothetical protein
VLKIIPTLLGINKIAVWMSANGTKSAVDSDSRNLDMKNFIYVITYTSLFKKLAN